MNKSITLPIVLFVFGCCLCPAWTYAQCGGGPCDAERYTRGSNWNPNGTVDDSPQASGGVIRCGNSAETQSNIQPNSCYDPSVFTVTPMNCVDPENGQPINLTGPVAGQPVTWFNFDVRAFSSNFDFQVISNDNLGWALYQSTTWTTPPPNGTLSGNCSMLTFNSCGTNFTGWKATPFQNLNQPHPVNFYLVVWNQDYQPGDPGSGDLNFNFKARYGCGEQMCNYATGPQSLQCLGSTYTVTIPVTGNNVSLTASDPLANSIVYSPNPLILTNPGANNPVTSGTITATYSAGEPYNLVITPSSQFSGCSATTISGYSPPFCCGPTITCPAPVTVQCASQVPAPNPAGLTATNNCPNTSNCGAFCTYTQGGYGNAGGTHSNGLNTTQTLEALLQSGPIVIGGGAGNCGFQIATAACVLGVLPGGGPSVPLPQNYMLDCNSPVQNTLVAQLVTLQLNVRYNLQFNNNLNLANAALTCVLTPGQIAALNLSPTAKISDLIVRANAFLASQCNGNTFPSGYGGLLTSAIATINEFWDECQNPANPGNAPIITFVSDVISGQTCPNRYTITRTYMATNSLGNTATCTQVITVYDDTAPAITCPAPVTVQCADDVPAPDPDAVTASDNCGTVTVTFVNDVLSLQNGTVTRTYRATDACGNSATCTQLITILSTSTLPTITCPDPVTVECASQVPPPDPDAVNLVNDCLGQSVTVTFVGDVISYQVCPNRYMITRTYQATDGYGNTATCTQLINVFDDTPPTIACPAPVTVQCPNNLPAPNTGAVVASDNCGGPVTVTHVNDMPNMQNNTVIRTYRATDACGNSATCTQVITVTTTNNTPTITCPAEITVECASLVPAPNPGSVTATSPCGGNVTVTFVNDVISYQVCPNRYMITRTYLATDMYGNTASCTQLINVFDDTSPAITCPAPVTVQCPNNVPAPNPGAVVATDNCGGAVTVTFVNDVPNNQNHTIVRTYRATDVCGNSATCTQLITINDNTPPSITCPAEITVECASLVPAPNPGAVVATDNCGGTVTVVFVNDVISYQVCPNRYMITRTYKATDAYGNTATCTQLINVFDDTPPVLSAAPANVTVQCNAVPTQATLTATDNCGGAVTVTPTATTTPGNCPDAYVIVRKWTATDLCGNTATVTQTVTVIDNVAPVLSAAPANVTVQCNAVPPQATLTATDNCDASVTVTPTSSTTQGNCPNAYTIVRVWTATDNCGNTASVSQTVTVIDNTPPTITCPAPITVQCPNQVPAPNPGAVVATDNCGGSVTVTFINDVPHPPTNTITRTYRATDACGNTATCTQLITINDTTPPTITCPAGLTVECASLVPSPNPGAVVATDNCGGNVTVTFLNDGISNQTCPNRYTITRVYRAMDASGNSATCAQTITVYDDTPPVLSAAPANVTVQCNAVPTQATLTATDNCGGAVTVTPTSSTTAGNCPDAYVIIRVWTASDACGNTATASQTVTVIDNVPPVLSAAPANVTVQCNAVPPQATLTATDNCDASVTVTPTSSTTQGNCPDAYTIVRVWTATDNCGNTASVSQTVTVIDNVPPVLSGAPANVTVQCNAVPPQATLTATDNCDASVTVTPTATTNQGNCPNAYTIVRVWTATDNCGNTASVSQTVTVIDNVPPTVTCPAPITVQCNDQVPAPNTGSVVATDNCGGAVTVTFINDVPNPPTNTIVRTYRATDACGNMATCTQLITIDDDTPPTITCPAPVTVECAGLVPAPNPGAVVATDNCGGNVTVTFLNDGISNQTCPNHYTITRVYRAIDASGNSATCAQTITVHDDTPPVLSAAPANVTVQCNAVPSQATLTATDNCGGAVTVTPTSSPTQGSCPNAYTLVRVWTATDACGNTATASQTVTVIDNTAPTITCPAAITVQCSSNVPAPNIASVVATDNCGGAVTITFVGDVPNPQNNTIVRTYQATDACGNTASCTQLITITGGGVPLIACPAPVTVQCASLVPAPNPGSVTASDPCGGTVTVTFVNDVFSNEICVNRYTITRTYLATSSSGSTATCTQVITVDDTTVPTITCPAPVTVQCPDEVPPPNSGAVVATDNCGTVTVSFAGEVYTNQNTTLTRTYQATDACGNTATCTQVITILTTSTIPNISCPDPVTVECASLVPAPDPSTVNLINDCLAQSVTVSFVGDQITNQTCPNRYTIIRTYQATDGVNTATCTQVITVYDNKAPVVTCPAPITAECEDDVPAPDPASVVATDNCGTVTVTFVGDAIDFQTSIVTRTYQATDACGNVATCTQLITVTGDSSLTITCPDSLTVQCASQVPAPDPSGIVVTDACGVTCGAFCTYTQGGYGSPGGMHSNGMNTTQTLDALMLAGPIVIGGGPGNCGFQITTSACVLGILPAGGPSVPLAQNFTLDCTQPVQNTLVGQLVTLILNVRYNLEFNNELDLGAAALTCVLTPDQIDSLYLAPTATVGDLIALSNNFLAGNCNMTSYPSGFGGKLAAATAAINEFWDECQNQGNPAPVVTFVGDSIANQTCPNRYTIFRTYQATNASGDTATCTQVIIVDDETAPSITCPASVTVQCPDDIPAPNPAAVITTDNCTGTVTVTFVSDVFSNQNTVLTRTYRATDVCGNSATCTQVIHIISTSTAPNITCPAPITVECASLVPAPDPSSVSTSTNCGGAAATVTFVGDEINYQVCPNRYMIVRTYLATDAAGNTATCTQQITVFDDTPPVLSAAPANVTVQCDAVPTMPTLTATDNCGGPVTVLPASSITMGNCPNSYFIHRSWLATDACGNTAVASQNITVIDNTPPVITCPAPVTVQCPDDVPTPSTGSVVTSDNCSGTVTVTFVSDVPDVANNTITRTYRATDVCGNSATCTQLISIISTSTAPNITCPANVTVQCASLVPAPDPDAVGINNNCLGQSVTVSFVGDQITNQTCPNRYTIIRTYQATDGVNTATCTQVITVHDNTVPVITCPAPVTVSCLDDVPTPNPGAIVATDNCAGAVTVTFVADAIDFQTSVVTRTYMATDACGNTATCTQLITVTGDATPTITCPAPVTVSCTSLVPAPDPSTVVAVDNCGNNCGSFCTYTQGGYGNSGGTHSNGLNTTQTLDILLQAGPIVIGGGPGNCGFEVTSTDCVLGILPGGGPSVPLAQNFTLDCNNALGNALAAQLVTVILNVRYNQEFNNDQDLGAAALTCVLTADQIDDLGLSPTATVADLIALSNDFLSSICTGASYPNGFGGGLTAALSDINEHWHDCQNPGGGNNTPPVVTFVSDVISNQTCPNRYTITRTYLATSSSGNTATCTQTITVNDQTAPSITCPAPVTVTCMEDVPAPNPGSVMMSDNCGGPVTVTFVNDVSSGSCPMTITRTYRAIDACGNSATCTQLITVDDNTAPTITCPAPITVACADDVPAPNTGSVVTTDNCDATVVVTFVGDAIDFQNSTVTRTYLATDGCGNTATCTQVITVINFTSQPNIMCPENITVQCPSQVPEPDPDVVGATDPCGGAAPTVSFVEDVVSDSTCVNRYVITRTYIATDANGNTATCTQLITVHDNTAPTITCPAPVTVQCPGQVPAPDLGLVVAFDNCSGNTTNCGAFCTYTQGAYGSPGGLHSNGLNTTQTLNILLQSGPIVIGGGPGNCGFQVSTTDCILGILPAGGPSVPLDTGFTLDCDDKLNNTLVGQLITLQLNIRYNQQFNNNLNLGAAALTCVLTPAQIAALNLSPSATVNQLITLSNTYLASNCNGNSYPNGFGGLLAAATGAINEFWDECQNQNGGGLAATVTFVSDVITNQTCPNRYVITRTYRATDECGNSATCTQVITVHDNTAPTGTCPADITVSSIDDVPADASDPAVIALMDQIELAYVDNCGGTVTVSFLNVSALILCSDPNSNGSFSRTFYFQIVDACGNTTLCDVTYTGTCMNFCTYTQGGYGQSGGVHSNGLTTTETLDSLMQLGPIVIGGGAGNCGFQVLTTDCIFGILPGGGPSVPLAQNFSLDCGQALNNALAAQLVTVLLNIRYNDEFNDADLGAAPLSCLFTDQQIADLALDADATVDDLVTLANDYLGSICNGSSYPNGFGGTIASALSAINEYWHDCQNQNACIPGPDNLGNDGEGLNAMIIYPSPATDKVFVKFDHEGTAEFKLRLFASDGKLVRTIDLVTSKGENLIEIDLQGLASGIYWINVAGDDMAKTKPFTIVKP